MSSWSERMAHDPALKAFVDGEIGRACVRLASLEVEHTRDLEAIAHLRQRVKELESELRQRSARKGKRHDADDEVLAAAPMPTETLRDL